jgi:Domain of unknown function (DU1801)
MPHQFTQTTNSTVEYLSNYENQKVIPDCYDLIDIMSKVLDCEPVLWGKMVGFGKYHYKYESGREGDSFVIGFAPSKIGITIYTNCYLNPKTDLLAKLGNHKSSKACIYIKKLGDIDLVILEQLLSYSIEYMKSHYTIVE